MTSLLFISGSTRKESINMKLAKLAGKRASEKGMKVELVNISDYKMPIFNGDIEDQQGIPDNARIIRNKIAAADGIFIASPEYNGSITPILKNMIDWTSRPDGNVPGLAAYRGKVVALAAASPGSLGGLRGLAHVREILGGIGCFMVPTQYAMSTAIGGFKEDGSLSNARDIAMVESLLDEFIHAAEALTA